MTDEGFEAIILRFEQSWRVRGRADIRSHLGGLPEADLGRYRLLVELVCVDLEYRWRKPGDDPRPTLADYVQQFPELLSLERLPPELIGEEYRVRRRWGDRPSHAAFLTPYGERRERLEPELFRIDREIEEETSGRRTAPHPARRRSPADGQAGLELDAPLLSHREFLLRPLIGAGRMGKVYEARQHGTGRDVAVKFLRNSLLDHPDVVRRFVAEARTVAGLSHPNIVGTQGLGRTPGGSYFIVMVLVSGPDLARLGRERPVAVCEAVRWATEACDALAHAHERGVIHCDLKPANLLLGEGGSVRVADFGLARSLGGETPGAAEVEGTAPFMAPEQAARCLGPIDHRTDVYGLGAVLFTLLTGRPPFSGRRLPDVISEVLSLTPVIPPASIRPGLPGPVDAVCRRCLEKKPAYRFPSIREARSALVEAMRGV